MPITSDMLNNPIGAVTYSPSDSSSSTLHARWAFSAQQDVYVVCTGIAVRCETEPASTKGPGVKGNTSRNDPFIGTYTITYAGLDGQVSDPWDLLITKKDEVYHAIWSKNDIAHYHGIGFVSQKNLICGWRPVT
jgi:hypothetical protein